MPLQAADIADLVSTTQRELGRLKWTDISLDLQNYIALPRILRKERVEFGSGYEIQWNVQVANAGGARNVGLYATDSVNVADVMQTARAPYRHTNVAYAIERREVAMNREPARIVQLVKVRRHTAMNDLAELMETNFWTKPTDSTDNVKPFGVPYWVVKSNTTGFNGTNPSGFTSGAGNLSSSTYPNWANYTAQYTNVTTDDLVRKVRAALVKCNFVAPDPQPDYARGGHRYGLYTNYDVIGPLEELAVQQNENLGSDLASMDGRAMIRRIPLTYVAYLDADTNDPVFGLDWSVFYPCFLESEYMNEMTMPPASTQHTVINTHIDNSYNFKCTNRRNLFVIALNT